MKAAALSAALLAGFVAVAPAAAGTLALEGVSAQKSWAAAVRMGDAGARWSLAWAYAGAGDLPRAWQWVRETPVGGDPERGYFKAWLSWRLGRPGAVGALLDESGCDQPRCRMLRVNALWDMDEWAAARDVARRWVPDVGVVGPEDLRLAMLAALLAGDWAGFDVLNARVEWRIFPEFDSVREQLRAMSKLRANF